MVRVASPVADAGSIAQAKATIVLEEQGRGLGRAAKKQDKETSLEQRQLEAVDATLAALTGQTDVSGLGLSGCPGRFSRSIRLRTTTPMPTASLGMRG